MDKIEFTLLVNEILDELMELKELYNLLNVGED